MNDLDLLIARTQRNVTYFYGVLIALVVCALLFMPKPIDESVRTILLMMLSALIALATQQSSFWFARSRSAGVPEPGTTTITTGPASASPLTTTVTTGDPNAPTTTTVQTNAGPAGTDPAERL